jgi:hypothetical protein
MAFVDQGDTGAQPAAAAARHGMQLAVIKLPTAKMGFDLLPRRLARDYERLPETLAGLHFLAFAILMLKRFIGLLAHSS